MSSSDTQNEPSDEPNEIKFLASAAALADHYRISCERGTQQEEATRAHWRAKSAKFEIEYQLAEADALYATARLTVFGLVREIRRLGSLRHNTSTFAEDHRKELLRSCLSGSESKMLAANERHSKVWLEYDQASIQLQKNKAELSEAYVALSRASSKRRSLKEKQLLAVAQLQHAATAFQNNPTSTMSFEIQDQVVKTGFALTNTSLERYDSNYLHWQDFGVTMTGFGKRNAMSPADWELMFASGEGDSTREPARED